MLVMAQVRARPAQVSEHCRPRVSMPSLTIYVDISLAALLHCYVAASDSGSMRAHVLTGHATAELCIRDVGLQIKFSLVSCL